MTGMTIAHATALSTEDEPIFEQAVALACAMNARLLSVNAHQSVQTAAPTPSAETVLANWGRAADSVEHELMIHSCCDDHVDTLLDALSRVKPDLIVTGTHQRKGMARLFEGSRAEAIVCNANAPILVFPIGARSLLDGLGRFDLRRIVIPVGDAASAKAALAQVAWLADAAASATLELVIVVAEDAKVPTIDLPLRDGLQARVVSSDGPLTDVVTKHAHEACIIVMATRGANSLADALLGTNTEHVLRDTRCPILVVPMS
jgi:nucleotide-binding universal stress UspA family protein